MNPVTVDVLNSAEKYRRSKQVEVCQLMNRAQPGRSTRQSLLERVIYALRALPRRGRSIAEKRRTPPDMQELGQATE